MKVKRYSFHFRICLQQNVQKIFYLKKSLTEQDKKFTYPLHLKEYLFICTERPNITVTERAAEKFVASDHGGCYMAVHYDCCASDGKVESLVKTVELNFSPL